MFAILSLDYTVGMKPQNQGNLELTYIVPTVTSDGNGVFISNDGNIPTLTFFQVRRQQGDKVSADIVASVRLSDLQDLKNLQATIEETIRNHTTREAWCGYWVLLRLNSQAAMGTDTINIPKLQLTANHA